MLLAKPDQLTRALHAEQGFEATWLVVDARMNNSTVMPCLMGGDDALLLKHRERNIREAAGNLQRRRKSYDPAADYDDAYPIGHWTFMFAAQAPALLLAIWSAIGSGNLS